MSRFDESVILHLKLADEGFGGTFERARWAVLESVLRAMLAALEQGEVDGHEVGEGFLKIFIYGASGESVLRTVLLQMSLWRPRKGSYAEMEDVEGTMRYVEFG